MSMVPGMVITNRVAASAEYTVHLEKLGNPAYVAPMRVTFVAETDKEGDLDIYRSEIEEAVAMFNRHMVMSIRNSYFLHVVEPKNGHTIQTFVKAVDTKIQEVAAERRGLGYVGIGDEVPTSTKSGIHCFVTRKEPTLEYMSAIVLQRLPWAKQVRATADSGISATVSWEDQPVLL